CSDGGGTITRRDMLRGAETRRLKELLGEENKSDKTKQFGGASQKVLTGKGGRISLGDNYLSWRREYRFYTNECRLKPEQRNSAFRREKREGNYPEKIRLMHPGTALNRDRGTVPVAGRSKRRSVRVEVLLIQYAGHTQMQSDRT